MTIDDYSLGSFGIGGGSGGGGGGSESGLFLILPFGDSHVLGAGDNESVNGQFGFRDHLQDLLGVGTFNFVGPFTDPDTNPTYDTDHAGIGGTTSANGLTRIHATLVQFMSGEISSTSKAIVDFGTNDANQNVTPSVTVQNIHNIVLQINDFNPNISIYVVLPNPTRNAALTAKIAALNALTEADILALRSTITNLHVVDLYSRFLENPDWMEAYLSHVGQSHPNDAGYQVEAVLLHSCMTAPTSTYCDGN